MNYYKRWIGDFQRKTRHLSILERGVYSDLLDHYYATEKPLPSDHASLCRIVGCQTKAERQAVGRIADEFFPEKDGVRANKRADEEIVEAGKLRDVAKTNGLRGGRPRDNPAGIPAGIPELTQPEPTIKARHSHSQEPDKVREAVNGVSRSLRAQSPMVDYSDPAQRTARWMQKMTDYVNRALPAEKATKLIMARINEEPWAVDEFNRLDKERKAKEART